MGQRVRIGVTSNGRRWAPSWWCIALAVRLAGGIPRRISVRNPAPGETFDGLIVSGGDDIGPDLYGGEEMPKARIDHERDALEVRWLRWAMDRQVPVLGICRGAQLLNAVRGGSLLQDVTSLRHKTSNRASLLPRKRVTVDEESGLAALLGRAKVRVNSLHHQAIDTPGDGLRIVARDADGICQAIEGTALRSVFGVQWHPEYLLYLPAQFGLFRALVTKAQALRGSAPEACEGTAPQPVATSAGTSTGQPVQQTANSLDAPGEVTATLERPLPLYGHHGQRLGTVDRVHICDNRIRGYELVTPWQRLQLAGNAVHLDSRRSRLRLAGEARGALRPSNRNAQALRFARKERSSVPSKRVS